MASNDKPPATSQATDSLVTRLAGPSTTKAGLAKDQTEINRIIAEESKGSKFYENEKRKDKDLTERIARILKCRDEVMKGANIQRIEKSVDQLLIELEASRDLSQYIVHIDMDAFFANVELLYNEKLQGKPFGVGKGVLTTASYEARKFGVRSGMPGFIAKKLCPHLIFVPINPGRYIENSEKVMNVFRRYDPNLHAAGCDEAYLNITAYCKEHDISPEECVQEMRAKVKEETKLTASAGIAPNKMLAKICSDKNKPNGQFYLPFDRKNIVEFVHDLPIRKIPGVGRVNERLLDAIGIKICGDIFTHRAEVSLMDKQFGLNFLLRTYLGIASNVVQPEQREDRKSVGSERTFKALSDKDKILEKLEDVASELEDDLARTGFTGKTVTLKYKLDTYQVFNRGKSFSRWISTKKEDLFAIGKELLLPAFPLTIRLIGLRVTKLKDLRASSPAGGIKRFFEPISSSPHKRRKLQDESEDFVIQTDADGDMDVHDEAMPGFYEHDEEDAEMGVDIDDLDNDLSEPTAGPSSRRIARPRPPDSAPAPSSQDKSLLGSNIHKKPRSTGAPIVASSSRLKEPEMNNSASLSLLARHPDKSDEIRALECPICARTLETDNQGLNSHVDFCLSRGAILKAQSKAKSPAKSFKGWDQKGASRKRKKG